MRLKYNIYPFIFLYLRSDMKSKMIPLRIEKMKTIPYIIQALFVLPPPGPTPSVLSIIARINPPIYPIPAAADVL